MKEISGYLKKFKNIQPPERTVRSVFIDVVNDTCGITLKNHEVAYKHQTVFLSSSPVIKSEILLNKALILRLCKERLLGRETVREIR